MHMDFSAISQNNLHHAYFIEGEHEYIVPLLVEHLSREGISSASPVSIQTIPVFYIEDARDLRASQLTVADGRRVIIVAFDRMIEAAQHALLKTLEEPTAGTHFFFISRNRNALLATVRSRMIAINPTGRTDTTEADTRAKEYLSLDYFGRMEMMKSLVGEARGEDDEDDEERARARRELVQFLDGIERVIAELLHKGDTSLVPFAEYIIGAKRDLSDPSPSIKMLFEHLAIRLPRIKK